MPKCIVCGEEYADEKQHLIDRHNLLYEFSNLGDYYKIDFKPISKKVGGHATIPDKLLQPSLLTEIAYYLGLVCLFLAGFIFGNILMLAYLIIIK
jgi:hypothetical protein